jgi:tRNA threonylcarbamoyladenosine modification (KEOPS) complex  Pcc1 subunit
VSQSSLREWINPPSAFLHQRAELIIVNLPILLRIQILKTLIGICLRYFNAQFVQATEKLDEIYRSVVIHVKKVKRFAHVLKLLMEDAPYNLEVVGQVRLQATIRSFLRVVVVAGIGGEDLVDVTRLVLDFLDFDGEEVANIDYFN